VIVVDFVPPARGITITVDDSGGADFEKIQDAINVSSDGDTVFVFNGLYNERIIINRSINLNGEDKRTTKINGSGDLDTIKVTSDWVNITGFTISGAGVTGSPDTDAGIELNLVDNCSIYNNILIGNIYNFFIYNSSDNSIHDNALMGDRIRLRNSHRNNFSNNYRSGDIFFGWIYCSDFNKFVNNTNISLEISECSGYEIHNNTFVDRGIVIYGDRLEYWNTHTIDTTNTINGTSLYYQKDQTSGIVPIEETQVILANCSNFVIKNNNYTKEYTGIRLGFCKNNSIINNVLSPKTTGIHLHYSNDNNISGNDVSDAEFGIYTRSSDKNTIGDNTIYNCSISGI
jgi:parallel beta-helix repeat protein